MFACDANPLVDSRLYNISDNRALEDIETGRAERIVLADGRWAIQLKPRPEEERERSIGRGNLVPFGRTYNRLMDPPSISYEIPHAGDLGIRRHGLYSRDNVLLRSRIKVSARKIDFTAAAFMTPTRTLTVPNASASSLMHSA